MKISASIYSDGQRPLKEVIEDLNAHQVDLFHVDCNDDPKVFDDISTVKSISEIPIDLHIISKNPERYFGELRKHKVAYLAIQYEELPENFEYPKDLAQKIGLAITTNTDISVFEKYKHCDFILIMATVPGQSGGIFSPTNFKKIREFRKKYPDKSIHVDGGVNAEVSFILRNMGVSTSVSGSYLFKEKSIGNALMNLTSRNISSHFVVEDFMIPISESPVVDIVDLNFEKVLKTIETGNVGFCIVLDKKKFVGIISNADIRKAMIRNIDHLNQLNTTKMINKQPLCIESRQTVVEMLQIIKNANFPVMYLPVLSHDEALGMITFVNLIKGEL